MNILSKLNGYRAILSPRCNEVSFQLTQTPLEQMPRHRSFFVSLHLMLCHACRSYRHNLIFLDHAFSAYPSHIEEVSARRLSDEARARIGAELREIG